MFTELKKAKNEAMAIDFENQQLKLENSELKKSNLSLSALSYESKNTSTKTTGTMTEQHGMPMITLPIIEKKKDQKFDLGEDTNRVSTNPALRQKLCRLQLPIVGIVKQAQDQKKLQPEPVTVKAEPQVMNVKRHQNSST